MLVSSHIRIAHAHRAYAAYHEASPQERAAAESDVARNTTPAYRAPEMWDVHRWGKIGRPADVWALGCLLYQLCFTRLPFGGAFPGVGRGAWGVGCRV